MPRLTINEMPRRKKILLVVMAIANKFLKKIELVNAIDDAVEWDEAHWKTSPGNLSKMLIIGTLTDMRVPLTHLKERLHEIDKGFFFRRSEPRRKYQ